MDVRALKRAEAATKRANDLAALYSSDDLTGAPLTEAEKAEGEAARKTAVSLVGSAIRVVRAHLAEIEEKGTPKKKKTKQDEDMEFTVKANIPVATPVSNNIEIPASASDLEGVNQTVEEMFDGAKDVIKDFDKVLEFPSLQGVTATLDTVPVIGIRGRKLMYTKHTVVDGNASSAFEEFDDLPHDAPEDISTARVFPFNGHLFLFIGTAVWKKEHRFTGSDELVDTVDKWPKMYQEGWFKIGDNVFSADIVDASFYGELTDPTDVNSAPITRILLLDSAGQLHAFGGDLQTSADAKNFVPVGFVPSDGVPDAPPAWTKIAYSRGVMHAFADGDIWQLDMKLTETSGQYTIQDSSTSTRVTVGQVLEMEGNEIGLVLRRDDGFLYQQYIEMADSEKSPTNAFLYEHPEAATADPALVELAYKKWVSIPSDLRMIGVASPGVGLDLMVLTSAHRDRYLRTQTVLYPVVEKIRTFAEVHSSYLEYLQTEADKYSIDSPPPDEVAIAHAQNYIAHIGFWSGFINDTTTGVKGTVNSMSADAGKVTEQLKIQLSNIEVQLEVMEANLDILEEAKDTARLMIIAGIVVALGGVLALLGIAYTNGPFLSPAGAAGGLLLVTGDAIAAFGFKTLIEINEDIARVEAGIGDLTAASMRYQAISEQYDGIDTAYEALDTFWGLMFNDVRQRELISVDSFQAMGASLLLQHQSFSIDAAQAAVDKLVGGCTAYLDLLNSQGVQVGTTARSAPTRRTVFVGDWAKEDAFNARATKLGPISQADVKSDTADFSRAASYGEQLLKNGDVAAYLKHLELEIVPRGRVAATVLDGEVVRVRV
eukprot:g10735.t1